MGEQQTESASNAAERVAIDGQAAGEAVEKALAHVNAIVNNIASVVKAAPAAAATEAPAEETPAEESDEDVEKASFAGLMKQFGVKMTPEMMAKMKAAGFDPSQKFPTAKPPSGKTEKAAGTSETEATPAAVTESLTMESFAELIAKAKKFTPGRVEKLKAAFETLKGLLEEIDSVPVGTNPGVSTPASTSFGASGVMDLTKSITEALSPIMDTVKSLAESNQKLTEKVESIEKARPVSQSLEAEGTTETKTQKSSLWGGIL